jgi:hypothetical protein
MAAIGYSAAAVFWGLAHRAGRAGFRRFVPRAQESIGTKWQAPSFSGVMTGDSSGCWYGLNAPPVVPEC